MVVVAVVMGKLYFVVQLKSIIGTYLYFISNCVIRLVSAGDKMILDVEKRLLLPVPAK